MNAPVEGPTAPNPDAPLLATVGSSSGDACPSCGTYMAADQRYCLDCGHRRGDPRLPFMDAVVFMEAVRQPLPATTETPPPPPRSEKRGSISANASLIAGVGTLLLALGIGVLIGKTGEGPSTAPAQPSVISLGKAGETASTGAAPEASGAGKKGSAPAAGKGKASKASKAKASDDLETGSSGTTKAAEEVLKPAGDVKLPPPTVKPGGACDPGASGCDGGEFTGEFFGE